MKQYFRFLLYFCGAMTLIAGWILISRAIAKVPPVLIRAQTVVLPGPAGHFDFMDVDRARDRLLAAHKGTNTLTLLDLHSGRYLSAPRVGEDQGVAVDAKGDRYFVGDEKNHSLVAINARTFAKTGEVHLDGPVDAIAFDSRNGEIYAAEDEGDHVWVIDAKSMKVVSVIPIPGTPEVIQYSPKMNRIYLNIRSKNQIARINPKDNQIEAVWSTLPATSPHGLIIDQKWNRIYIAGRNGKLVAMNLKNGRVEADANIKKGVDQIAYDPGRHVIYSACKGFISVTQVTSRSLKELANVQSPKGAHTIAVDPKRHNVWVCYADKVHSYLVEYRNI